MLHVTVGTRILTPSKIVCVGRNYAAHIHELGNETPEQIVFFLKPNSAISDQLISFHQEPLHYEGELCFVYEQGRFSAVGFGFDLTKRALQTQLKTKGLPWERAKAFNGSAVFSSFVELANIENSDTIDQLQFELCKNDKLVQLGDIELMIHKPADILAELQSFMQLEDGDIVMTGTPAGVGMIEHNDNFKVIVKHQGITIIQQSWTAD